MMNNISSFSSVMGTIFLLLILLTLTHKGSDAISVEQELEALLDFKQSILQWNPSSSSSSILGSWKSSDQSPCSWKGIECGGSSRHVTTIDLRKQRLAGPIPAGGQLARLAGSLEHLLLASNFFNGSIPEEIGNCSNLRTLDLSNNTLSGQIPQSFWQLSSNIQALNFSSNNLTGIIPGELFSECRKLQLLDLSTNQLHGSIPEHLADCAALSILNLENNHLDGEIPQELGSRFTGLTDLNLANNHLHGAIPETIFSPSLQSLDLSLNNFTGAIPPAIGRSSKLINLTLSQNHLLEIPHEIGLLKSLQVLLLGKNNFTILPESIGNCSSLRVLILNENFFQGPIPPAIDKLQNLQYIVLHSNGFTGSIPDWLFKNHHQQLLHLDFSDNRISGDIPSWFNASFTSLKFLLLAGNSLEGAIPDSLGQVSNLQFLDLSSNRLTGSIPGSLGNLQRLLWLMLAKNNLTGAIPSSLGNCSSLLWLNAAGNSISGELPQELEFMGRNVKATFDENEANLPPVPKEIGECTVLRRWLPSNYPPFSNVISVLDRDRCQVFWNLLLRGKFMYSVCSSIPTELSMGFIQLSDNQISGAIPESFGRIERLSLLFLYQNRLSGSIPESLGDLKLTGLNLSQNALTGPIPESFGRFRCLQSLDLSINNLSGGIPSSLTNLTSLSRFNISYNPLLSGPIPFQQQFFTFDENSYIGDFRLCFFPIATGTIKPSSTIPFCGQNSSTKGSSGQQHSIRSMHASTILGISLACALGVIVMGIAAICWINRNTSGSSTSVDLAAADHTSFKVIKSSSGKFSSSRDPSSLGGDLTSVSIFTMDLPKQLTYNDLVHATGNFDESHIIGCGGFGIVYRASLSDGSTVAIKKLIREGPAADKEFQAEMHTLGHILHENLVPLMGYSSYGVQKLLVYEYMENGSLDDWLYGSPVGKLEGLDWPLRLDVAIGTARGLKFLHHSCCPAIIHRDMKASNILLDSCFRPRLTDFGLARALAAQEETHVSTIVAGTLGYVPPEYCQTWRATVKGDVYSFGVVLLELLSGRRPMLEMNNVKDGFDLCGNLVEWATECYREGRLGRFFDELVVRSGSEDDRLSVLSLALDCTQDIPVRRPCMRDVVKRLEDVKQSF